MVIVDSPGIGDSEQVNKITLDYLPRAYAFIYVLNSSNAGGLQEDRVSKKIKQYPHPTPPHPPAPCHQTALNGGRVVRLWVHCVVL